VQEQDIPLIAATESAIGPEPWAEEQVREWEEFCRTDRDYPMRWFVAVGHDGAFAGWGNCGKASWLASDEREIHVAVPPERRRQGVGGSLLEHAEALASKDRPKNLKAWCRGYDRDSFEWAVRRGYVLERQRTESLLDLSSFDVSRFRKQLADVESQGIEALTLWDHEVDPYLPGLYHVFVESFRDAPFRSKEAEDTPYESWMHETMGGKSRKLFVLARKDSEVIGSTNLYMPLAEGQSASVNYTGVLREHRGKGLGLALKALAAAEGARAGAKQARTNNDPDNPAILRINEKLGFKPVPGPTILKKDLRPDVTSCRGDDRVSPPPEAPPHPRQGSYCRYLAIISSVTPRSLQTSAKNRPLGRTFLSCVS
jgi:GNAT superfamily N-acetyltransferase